ncbi:MAG: hypothetical protein K0S80_1012 [Neobacillus sp.]|jgi:hypothetical protein|nr:hypothetical protein [Neobacillus sp.]
MSSSKRHQKKSYFRLIILFAISFAFLCRFLNIRYIRYLVFWIVLFFFLIISIAFLCGLGKKNGSYIFKRGKADRWSTKRKTVFNIVIYCFFGLISIFCLIYIVIPMILDIPVVISGKSLTISGTITSASTDSGSRSLKSNQDITVRSNDFHTYFFPRFKKGEKVKIKYLPHSGFVLEIHKK